MPKTPSPYTNPDTRRHLRAEEKALLRAMLSDYYSEPKLTPMLDESEVEEMLDGGMGSIRFVGEEHSTRHLGKVLCTASFVDADDTLVSISVNTDQYGALFEVDLWKVDFSPLQRYPSANELTVEES